MGKLGGPWTGNRFAFLPPHDLQLVEAQFPGCADAVRSRILLGPLFCDCLPSQMPSHVVEFYRHLLELIDHPSSASWCFPGSETAFAAGLMRPFFDGKGSGVDVAAVVGEGEEDATRDWVETVVRETLPPVEANRTSAASCARF